MVDWVNDGELAPEQQAYVTANLIRGGVYELLYRYHLTARSRNHDRLYLAKGLPTSAYCPG